MRSYIRIILFSIFSVLCLSSARASHLAGGSMTYAYMGDSLSGSGDTFYKYRVTLTIYEDCLNGSPQAIAQDNPAFFSAFRPLTGSAYAVYELDSFSEGPNAIYYASSVTIPEAYANSCGLSSTNVGTCLLQKKFIKDYAFPASTTGYVISYQRCCWNASIDNINDPANDGSTISCTIPPTTVINNSAVFKNDPPSLACLNSRYYFDCSATDADGDSLSYGFAAPLDGADNSVNSKPVPVPPPYDSLIYIAPYSSQTPLSAAPAFTIDPVTGIITGTPNLIGRYLIDVCCYEWRAGILVNKVNNEFEIVITPCNTDVFAATAGPDTVVFVNTVVPFFAAAVASYTWSPSTFLSSTTIANPVGTFTEPGNFTYEVHEMTDSGCEGTATVHIQVLEYSNFIVPSAFTPNNDGLNDYLQPIPVLGSTLISFKIFDRKGILVYNGGPNSLGWDGTYKGFNQDIGTYYWELLYDDSKGNTRHMKGDVTLIR